MMPTFEQPNADAQPLPEAGATQERTLEAVGCSGLLGQALVISSRPAHRPSRLGSHDAPAACSPGDGTGVSWGGFPKTPVQKFLLACLSACLRILIGVNITGRRGKVANILRLVESAKILAQLEHIVYGVLISLPIRDETNARRGLDSIDLFGQGLCGIRLAHQEAQGFFTVGRIACPRPRLLVGPGEAPRPLLVLVEPVDAGGK